MRKLWFTASVLLATVGFVCLLSLAIWVLAHVIFLGLELDAKGVVSLIVCFVFSLLLGGWVAYALH